MQVSSANIAVSLLSGVSLGAGGSAVCGLAQRSGAPVQNQAAGLSRQPAQRSLLEGSADTYTPAVPKPDMTEVFSHARKVMAVNEALRNAEVSPFDEATARTLGSRIVFQQWVQDKDPRMEFEGSFSNSVAAPMGTTAPRKDANFLTRSDAMAFAYHYSTRTADAAKQVVVDKAELDLNGDRMRDASGQLYGVAADGRLFGDWGANVAADAHGTHGIALNRYSLEVATASLANLFSFDSATVTNAAYAGQFTGFSVTHGALGKIMDVAADGVVTLYDADGTSYSAAEYSAANVDGGIPQLRNDLLRHADRRAALA